MPRCHSVCDRGTDRTQNQAQQGVPHEARDEQIRELIGRGANTVTGDYSRGAAGFRIRDGKLAEPVAEITIAGNLIDMFARLIPANDLEYRYGTNAPTILIEGMTIAGR